MRIWAWVCIVSAVVIYVGGTFIEIALGLRWNGFLLLAIAVLIGMAGGFLIVRSAALRDAVEMSAPPHDD